MPEQGAAEFLGLGTSAPGSKTDTPSVCPAAKLNRRLSDALYGYARRVWSVCVDPELIANNFAHYFSEIYTPNNDQRASSLHNEYISLRENYFGLPLPANSVFDTELVSKVISNLKMWESP